MASQPGGQVMTRGRMKGEKIGPYCVYRRNSAGVTAERRLRLEAGLTQTELAELAGCSERAVRNFDRWGGTFSKEYRACLVVLGRRVTAALLDDCPVKRQAIELATQTGKDAAH